MKKTIRTTLLILLAAAFAGVLILASCAPSDPGPGSSAEPSRTEQTPGGDASATEESRSGAESPEQQSSGQPASDQPSESDPAPSAESSRTEESAKEPSSSREESKSGEESSKTPEPVSKVYHAGKAEEYKPDTAHLSGIRILGCSFTSDSGKAVVVGTCDRGVSIQAETKYGKTTAETFYGYFAVSVDCPTTSVIVTLTEWLDGEKIGKVVAEECTPVKPGPDMWGVVAGQNSHLFLQKAMPEFTGSTKLSAQFLSNFKNKIADRVQKAKEIGDGCEIIYIIVPTQATAFPEDAGDGYKAGDETRYTQMLKAINEAGATAIDLRPVYRAARERGDEMPVYYMTDSHWSEYGAYLAYVELFKVVSERFPAAAPRGFDEFNWTSSEYPSGDLIYYLDMNATKIREHQWLRTPAFALSGSLASFARYNGSGTLAYSGFTSTAINGTTLRTGNKDLPDMTIFRDSYAAQLMDIVAERCNVSYWPAMWSYTWNIAQLKRDAPDYVVYVLSEWNAGSLLN